ncbi:MAG: acetyltransferase [Methanoregula sp.]|jgi:hypothetical protein
MRDAALPEIFTALSEYISKVRDENGWSGPVDIVSHSMGTCIVRYLLEVIDGTEHSQKVRQQIGLGPPTTARRLQNSFYYPKRGEEIINKLTGIFVPRGFDPVSDRIMQDVRPGNPVIYSLRTAGLRSDITYKIIMTTNPGDGNGFFPWFDGKTWEIADDGCYRATINGDGVVHHRESVLPGISLDIIPAPHEQGGSFSCSGPVLPY